MNDNEKTEINAINMMPLKNEKLKWNRLHGKMQKYLDKIKPIEEDILELQNKRAPIIDDIGYLRIEMVDTCIHPKDLLIHKGNYILCKFCNKKISIPIKKRTQHGIKEI